MSKSYTCDSCGRVCAGQSAESHIMVANGTDVRVAFEVKENEDLCRTCKATKLRIAADKIEQNRK